MRKPPSASLLCAAALVCCATFPAAAGAQTLWNGEMERGMRPGVYVPYDGAPLSQRYAYQTGGFLYFGGSARQLYLMDYLDRLDRAERFGYRPPPDPFRRPPAVHRSPGSPCCDTPPPPPVYYYRR
jgi:hypothetical protein